MIDASGTLQLSGDDEAPAPEPPPSQELSLLCERHHVLSVEATAFPTELGTAAPRYSKSLKLLASRPLCGALGPLWIIACVGPKARGPGGLLSESIVERLGAGLATIALPLEVWVVRLNQSWPSAYGAGLREAVAAARRQRRRPEASEDGDDTPKEPSLRLMEMAPETASVDTESSDGETLARRGLRRPAGSRLLECIAWALVPITLASAVAGIALYAGDAGRLDCRVEYVSYDDAATNKTETTTVTYPWSCTWASAAWLSTRLLGAVAVPLVLLVAAAFYAHILALLAAIEQNLDPSDDDDHDSAEVARLVDDANALWRWPLRALLLASAASALLASGQLGARLLGGTSHLLFDGPDRALAALAIALCFALPNLALVCRVNAKLDCLACSLAQQDDVEPVPADEDAAPPMHTYFVHDLLRLPYVAPIVVLFVILAAALGSALAYL